MPGYQPETWNPIVGCTKVSPGCDNCYAEKQAFIRAFNPNTPQYKNVVVKHPLNPRYREWNGTTQLVNSALTKPMKWKKPRMIFVCSMGDLFHESVSFETIEKVYDVMYSNKQHIFIVLTKRPERAYQFWQWLLNKVAGVGIQDVCSTLKDNIWMGVTAENQEQANKRISILLHIPASKRLVSIEPMLGPIDFYDININGEFYHTLKGFGDISGGDFGQFNGPKLDWVICGGETGPKARPMHPDWVRSVRDQCKEAGTPFFFKQWGTWCPEGTIKDYNFLIPSKEKVMGIDVMTRKPVVRNHDQLDGKQHHEWPDSTVTTCRDHTTQPNN